MTKSHTLSIREILHSQLCEMLTIGIHPKGRSSRSSTRSFDNFLAIDQEDIIDACWKPRCIIVIHKSRTNMMFIGNEHTTSARLKWFHNNIRKCHNIVIQSRMIGKNHGLEEHILHFEGYHFLEVFCSWFCKTTLRYHFKEFFFGPPESRLL